MTQLKRIRRSAVARTRRVGANGMVTFAMHSAEPAMKKRFSALRAGRRRDPGLPGIAATSGRELSSLDPETAARLYLQQALGETAIPGVVAPKAGESELKILGSESLPLTKTRVVKFRQTVDKIPVYGSLLTVELDQANLCLAIRSVMGEPEGVDPVARIAPAAVVAAAAKRAGRTAKDLGSVPRLHHYFDPKSISWRLAYILENVSTRGRGGRSRLLDFVFDAQSGALIAELPRTGRATVVKTEARDSLGTMRVFECEESGGVRTLRNETLRVRTHDFGFKDPDRREELLPGRAVTCPPVPWLPAAVSAHANAETVARFLRDVLQRRSIDNRGGVMTSSVNCVVAAESTGREWLNAYWNGRQMVYGQRKDGLSWHSMAENPDIVSHEVFHGVTDFTARLEYACESGALNESYSDIFGVIISNWSEPKLEKWNWEIGEGLDTGGKPFRNLRNPPKHDQPRHMRDYQHLPNTDGGDWGGVHVNSGIHNYAAYRILTAGGGKPKQFLFEPGQVAALFYICLTQYLSRTSSFADSRSGVGLAARTLFRGEEPALQRKKIRAVETGFAAAGIA